jgi:hypothetical protein
MVSLRTRVILACVLLLSATGFTQDHAHDTSEKLGSVHFASSCNPAAQQELDRAVALLHSFEFSRAISGFNAALQKDQTCGIAYWGIALSQWSNPFASGLKDKSQLQAGRDAAKAGTTAAAKTSPRCTPTSRTVPSAPA